MRNFQQLLDAYLDAKGFTSDYQLAKDLAVSPQYVWKIRHLGKATDPFCLEMAQVLGVDAATVMIARNALKETGPVGDAWKRALGQIALILIVAIGIYPEKQASAYPTDMTQVIDSTNKDYRKYQILYWIQAFRRIFRAIFPVMQFSRTPA